ncbi:patatin-like phospholipase family protein [Nitrosomonas sp.]|uniref:patatin-like phospholipase family protein n=1 Tax=Nitrosomonas sp. TaxID=42353 RepID=UPI001DD5A36B|nr:patatin-like phospholipase family protein [Nitrosomonas sp.]MCB1949172.1 patatin-like phospholipase family protein [Nitrosomonas sp.]
MTIVTNIPQGAADKEQDAAGVKRALILPGGGLRLSYAAGVIDELFAHGLKFQFMDGTSGGSLNLAMLLSGLKADEMCDRWRSLSMMDTISFGSLKDYFSDPFFVAAGSAEAFRKKVFPHLGIDVDKIRAASGMQATFNVCNFSTKSNEVIRHQNISEDFLIAGISLPGTLPPVQINGVNYLDSGFIQDANLLDPVKAGANELWLVWIMGNIPQYRSGLLNFYVQMLEMSANGALGKEILRISEINERIRNGEEVYGHRQPITLHLIKPAHPLPLDSALYTGQITHAHLIEMGRNDARSYFASMPPQGVPLDLNVLQMTQQSPGIYFKETMSGGFSLDTDDAEAGKKQGNRAGNELTMRVEVTIDDIDQFIENSDHAGHLAGKIDFPPLGMGMTADRGVFNLFSPADEPETKYMIYELSFVHLGQQYYLAGKKIIRDDPMFDLWDDTTTLYTRLYRGLDTSGEVIGAGILTLGVKELLQLISSMEVINPLLGTDKLSTLSKFGRFFVGELWDTYVMQLK